MKLEEYRDLENEDAMQRQHENRHVRGTLGCKDTCC